MMHLILFHDKGHCAATTCFLLLQVNCPEALISIEKYFYAGDGVQAILVFSTLKIKP
jgi:hypothetical protein